MGRLTTSNQTASTGAVAASELGSICLQVLEVLLKVDLLYGQLVTHPFISHALSLDARSFAA
jgi:hypothetical protein